VAFTPINSSSPGAGAADVGAGAPKVATSLSQKLGLPTASLDQLKEMVFQPGNRAPHFQSAILNEISQRIKGMPSWAEQGTAKKTLKAALSQEQWNFLSARLT
jgi:hypothetical protein